jgi:DNA-binding NtrC family response regulator
MPTILIVDDSPADRMVVRAFLNDLADEIIDVDSGEAALAIVREREVDVAFTDLKMPGMDGIETLVKLREACPQLPVVMVTGSHDTDSAIQAMLNGAFDYLTKPVEKEILREVATKAIDLGNRIKVQVEFKAPEPAEGERLIGRSRPMLGVYKSIGQSAASDATVLITGDSGTGKELVARAIHQHSKRGDAPLVIVNCASLPDSILESELFGHEKGSFTDAHEQRLGRFEQADGGSIFLDEIGEMSAKTQAKVLRVIQEKTFERVGGSKTLRCDVRVIAATNRNLAVEVDEGRFREDLYFRLNVIQLHLPPLRDRKEDLPELCEYLLGQVTHESGKPSALLSVDAMKFLLDYDWPGNIRQLRNSLASAAITAPGGIILPEHLNIQDSSPGSTEGPVTLNPQKLGAINEDLYEQMKDEFERQLFKYALRRTEGNKVHASKLLGVSRNYLRKRLGQFEED